METGKIFSEVAAIKANPKWELYIAREKPLYDRGNDIRCEFGRDYTRVLHCLAYRRLKHKTQVFFNTNNDHVCTRMEHVAHVESVSFSIANFLGLNTELTKAISAAHDLGHAPFGHHGETVLKEIAREYLSDDFWHEKNGLRFVDKIELLEDEKRFLRNLDLTYAVRDGIVSHCGEIDEDELFPREQYINLADYNKAAQYQPFTWEGCVVKISDKIAYIGRDIEDAYRLHFIDEEQRNQLYKIARKHKLNTLNTTTIMYNLITDLCTNSKPKTGLRFSKENFEMLKEIKAYNQDVIYNSDKLTSFKKYAGLIITEIFNALIDAYNGEYTISELIKRSKSDFELYGQFLSWIVNYCDQDVEALLHECRSKNEKIYHDLSDKTVYIQAILDYISGMTDKFAIRLFQGLVRF